MAKSIQKYFIAIVPSGDIQAQASDIKERVKEVYGAKHALKSPAHVTLKMPFSWNGNKEDKLVGLLEGFFGSVEPFKMTVKGIGRFGKRIMYSRVDGGEELLKMQSELKSFCRLQLKVVEELSDKAYTPHITLVYSDLKDRFFDECWAMLKEKGFYGEMKVDQVALLRKTDYRWHVVHYFPLGGK